MNRGLVFILLCVVGLARLTFALNILVIFPHPGTSHFHAFAKLFKGLANKGHEVTVISNCPAKDRIPNYRDVQIKGGVYDFFKSKKADDYMDLKKLPSNSKIFRYFLPFVVGDLAGETCETVFNDETFRDFLNERNKFDIAIIEYFNTDCFLTSTKTFGIPVIRAHSCSLMPWSGSRYGNPNNPAYIPNNLLALNDRMSFFERIENAISTWIHSVLFNFVIASRDRSVSMKYFGNLGASLDCDVLNDSLLLTASHFSVNLPRPLVPNLIEVGGLHIDKTKALPKVSSLVLNYIPNSQRYQIFVPVELFENRFA